MPVHGFTKPSEEVLVADVPHTRFFVHVWCAVSWFGVIGPFFFDETVDADVYKDMIENKFILECDARGIDWKRMWFLHDGASPHYAKSSRDCLAEYFGEKMIGRGCDFPWPAHSPDLIPT